MASRRRTAGTSRLTTFVPLCLGGPDILSNIQLQPWAQARRKDAVEIETCALVRAGSMTREQAVKIFTDHKGAW
jgi:hypothetical protein